MQTVQRDEVAGAQAYARADRRYVGLQEKPHLGIDQLEAGQQQHAVGIGERVRHPERVLAERLLQLPAPPVVGLDRQDEVGIVRRDDFGQPVRCPVVHQDVDDQKADGARPPGVSGPAHVDRPQTRVGQNDPQLHTKTHEQGEAHGPGERRHLGERHDPGERRRDQDRHLDPRKIACPHPPGLILVKRQDRGEDAEGAEPIQEQPLQHPAPSASCCSTARLRVFGRRARRLAANDPGHLARRSRNLDRIEGVHRHSLDRENSLRRRGNSMARGAGTAASARPQE